MERMQGDRGATATAGFLILLVVAASVAHTGYYRLHKTEFYPLTVYPMFAGHPSEFRSFYWVEVSGPEASQVLPGVEVFDADHALAEDQAQRTFGQLARLAARDCEAERLHRPMHCTGQADPSWRPPDDIVQAWTTAAEGRLGWSPDRFTVLRDPIAGEAPSQQMELLFSFSVAGEAADA